MPNRYDILQIGLDGVENHLAIIKDGTRGNDPLAITGNFILERPTINNVREVIRPTQLIITLNASQAQTFQDLFTENTRQWFVNLYRDNVLIFQGWLSNDSATEDFVNERYLITFTATDGLDDLSNAGYYTENGEVILGVDSLRNILIRCLNVTQILNDVLFVQTGGGDDKFPVVYSEDEFRLSFGDYFDQKIDQRVFLEEPNTPKKVEEVIKAILTPANACVFQFNDRWVVMWTLHWANPTPSGVYDFRAYDKNGLRLPDVQIDTNVTLGSQINVTVPPYWGKENQRIVRRASLGSAKIIYNFGDLASIIRNSELNNNGASIPDWTINQPAAVQLPNSDGVRITTGSEPQAAITSNFSTTTAPAGSFVKISVDIQAGPPTVPFGTTRYRQRFALILRTTGGDFYWMDENGFWVLGSQRRMEANATNVPITFTYQNETIEGTPEDGQFQFVIFPVDDDSGAINFSFFADITLANVGIFVQGTAQFPQESHTQTKTDKISTTTFEPFRSTIGDFSGTLWVSSLYQANGDDLSEFGFISPTVPNSVATVPENLFQIAMRDVLILQSKISKHFTGSIFGFIPYLSTVQIIGVPGIFVIAGWDWDALQNTIDLTLMEVFWENEIPNPGNPWFDDLDYQRILGDDVKTIQPPIRS